MLKRHSHSLHKFLTHCVLWDAFFLLWLDRERLIRYKFRWADADDEPQDNQLTISEMQDFRHPEQSSKMIVRMAKDIVENLGLYSVSCICNTLLTSFAVAYRVVQKRTIVIESKKHATLFLYTTSPETFKFLSPSYLAINCRYRYHSSLCPNHIIILYCEICGTYLTNDTVQVLFFLTSITVFIVWNQPIGRRVWTTGFSFFN